MTAKSWMLRILMFSPFLLPIVMRQRVPLYWHEAWWSVLIALLYLYLFTPMLDHIGGRYRGNAAVVQKPWIFKGAEYDLLPRVLCYQILAMKVLMIYAMVTIPLEGIALVVTAFVSGQFLGAYGIVIAHELLHRRSRFDKALAELLMVTVLYPHWCIEHPMGHHRHVGTRKDPATARYGESIYRFALRCMPGELIWACRNEKERLANRGLPWWSRQNRLYRYAAEVAALIAVMYLVAGPAGLIALFVHAAAAIFALQTIHYVQHYGIERKEISPGVFEPMTVRHSWDSPYRYSNLVLINLGRHADHHDVPNRSYQALRLFGRGEAPEMPWGFPTMFAVALIPPLWFRVMNPRVQELRRWNETPPKSKYTKLSLTSHDPDVLLEWLRAAYDRGRLQIDLLAIDAATRAKVMVTRWERLSGLLLVPVIALFFVAEAEWRRPWGFIFLASVMVVVLIARYFLARSGSDRALVRAALQSTYAWGLLWEKGKVEVRLPGDDAGACRSPDGDWQRFAQSHQADFEANQENVHGELVHGA
jgi:alkane 1-monooxygenase